MRTKSSTGGVCVSDGVYLSSDKGDKASLIERQWKLVISARKELNKIKNISVQMLSTPISQSDFKG